MSEKSVVALVPCSSYDKETVYWAMRNGIELLGGVEALDLPKQNLVIKPNLLKKAELNKAVITHPSVVEAFCRILYENGYRDMIVGDSCGHGVTSKVLAGLHMQESLESYGVDVQDFTDGGEIPWKKGKQAKSFHLSKQIVEAEGVVSICKMKTHALERVTGAVKNSYGFVYGRYKAMGHTLYPNADSFARMLVDLNQCVAPKLYIMDGIAAMEGNGPGAGDPVPMHVLLFSKDPVALDSVFCHLVHLRPALVPTNVHGEYMGLGSWKKENIKLMIPEGECTIEKAVSKYGNPSFKVDRRKEKFGKWERLSGLIQIFKKKPVIDKKKCVKCGICVNACPVEGKAIQFKNGKDQPPVYDYKKCIRCFCCQEMCPHKAIKVR